MHVSWAKQLVYFWMPPRIIQIVRNILGGYRNIVRGFRNTVRDYPGWRKLSLGIKNWRFCCFMQAFKSSPRLVALFAREYQLFSRPDKRLVTVRYRSGMQLLCYPDSLGVLFAAQDYLDRLGPDGSLSQGDVIIDIGAHVGTVSLPLAFDGATVFAYEPHPDNFRVLELNKSANKLDRFHPFPLAVSDRIGTASFEFGDYSTRGSLRDAGFPLRSREAGAVEVRTTTLPAIFFDNLIDEVKLLKIDAEGGEYDMMLPESTSDILKKCHFLILEVHPVDTGHDKNQLYAYLTNLGFQIKVFENPSTGCADFYCRNTSFNRRI